MVLPQEPITRARAKQFKEAVIALVQHVWDDVNARPIEPVSGHFGNPCRTFLQVQNAMNIWRLKASMNFEGAWTVGGLESLRCMFGQVHV
ncbi:hypothetical protein PVK06_027262 [Gossypium arboreum]|uniref:Uncharacterized protein n=1 Tax=Gossypium arboreum TaxID=29729 RepID=A0ABR0NZS9_GOSAR|nr:hypothetical protein PVK06_027262 [Gossypium arboreum]